MILQQYTDNLMAQLETSPYFKRFKGDAYVLGLIGLIKDPVLKSEDQKKLEYYLYMGSELLYGYYQQNNMK